MIERVATSNPDINELDHANSREEDVKIKIINLFNVIENMKSSDSAATDYPIGLE